MTTEPHAITLSWQPAVADYVEAFTARNRARKAWHKVAVIAGTGALFAVVAFSLGHPGPAMIGVEVAVLLPIAVPVVTRLSTRSLWRMFPDLNRFTRVTVAVAAGITTDGPLVDMSRRPMVVTILPDDLAWSGVAQVLETRSVFVVQLVGHRGKRFFLLAKRGLANPSDTDALRSMLDQRAAVTP